VSGASPIPFVGAFADGSSNFDKIFKIAIV
jgi:hypothetical protein